MGLMKTSAIMPLFIEDTDQVDHHAAPPEGIDEGCGVVDITLHPFNIYRQWVTVVLMASQDPYLMSIRYQAPGKVTTDKTAATNNHYSFPVHLRAMM
jgi:hypothetical protein